VNCLNAARRDSEQGFLLAPKDVADANQGISKLSEAAGVNRENLYRMLSEAGNPKLTSFHAVLAALDLDYQIVPRGHQARTVESPSSHRKKQQGKSRKAKTPS